MPLHDRVERYRQINANAMAEAFRVLTPKQRDKFDILRGPEFSMHSASQSR
jgi:Spy/CpxP family protein refolding chaperone